MAFETTGIKNRHLPLVRNRTTGSRLAFASQDHSEDKTPLDDEVAIFTISKAVSARAPKTATTDFAVMEGPNV